MPADNSISTSRQVQLALLEALGISARNVIKVEIDLSGPLALVNVSLVWRNSLTSRLLDEVSKYELRRLGEASHACNVSAALDLDQSSQTGGEAI